MPRLGQPGMEPMTNPRNFHFNLIPHLPLACLFLAVSIFLILPTVFLVVEQIYGLYNYRLRAQPPSHCEHIKTHYLLGNKALKLPPRRRSALPRNQCVYEA